MSQTNKVLSHIVKHGYITPLVARSYGVERLASRIYDLRRAGFNIVATTKYDDMQRKYTSYSFAF